MILSKNIINNLKENDPIIIVGHNNTDVDSIISCINLNNILTFLNIKSKIVITDKIISEDTVEALEYAGYNPYELQGEVVDSDKVFLVDHYQNTTNGQAMWCIDHHPNSMTKNYELYVNKRASATAKILYDIMEEINYPITKQDVFNTIVAIMLDTCSMKSAKCSEEEKIWVMTKIKEYNLDYDKLYELGLCLTNFNKPISEIVYNGIKYYNYSGIEVGTSYIQNYSYPKDINKYTTYIQENIIKSKENNLKLWVFLAVDMNKNICKEYHITKNSIKEINHDTILSRGLNVMPNIELNIKSIINE